MRRLVVIANPAARRGPRAEAAVRRACAARGIVCEVHRTSGPGDAARIATRIQGSLGGGDAIFVLGGDGTVVEVAGALVGTDIPVGVLPGGTGNQLARFLGVPLRISRAINAFEDGEGRSRLFDLGALGDGNHFAITAGLGMDAQMVLGATRRAKRRFGVAAYLWTAARAVFSARTFPVRITADGRLIEREAGVAMVVNLGELLNGRVRLGPGIAPDDGWLDLCVLTPRTFRDGVTLTWRMLRRDYREDPRMLFLRARTVRIEAPAGTPAQFDGEALPGPVLEARVVPGGVRFLLPGR